MQHSWLKRLQLATLLILSIVVVFSYLPVISLGTYSGLHLEISLIYIVLLIFVVVQLPAIYVERAALYKSRIIWAAGAYITFSCISVVWSDNPIRGIVTAGFQLMLFLAAIAISSQKKLLFRHRETIISLSAGAFAVAILIGFWQVFGDSLGFSRTLTLLPDNYTSTVFGVARPTGLSLEPQFFGSLLLIPFAVLLYRSLYRSRGLFSRESAALVMSGAMLLLTISRGALLACVVITCLLFTFVKAKHHLTRARLITFSLLSLSICFGLVVQFTAGSLNPNNKKTGIETINAVVSQLSLGRITFSTPKAPTAPESRAVPTTQPRSSYVASSSNSRISMSQAALDLWGNSPSNLLFGVGIGSFGASLHKQDASYSIGSVANNFYVELLAETGLVGTALFAGFICCLATALAKRRSWLHLSLLSGFLTQWSFFSGNANVVHVWLFLGFCIAAVSYPHINSQSRLL